MDNPIIALTMGDPAGIGPELIVKVLSRGTACGYSTYDRDCRPLVVGDPSVMRDICKVVGADLGMANTNCAFYRVVAVDAKGVRSGPSDYADMPRPMIWSRPEAEARTGERYTYRVKVVRSIGDLRTIVIDGNPYNSAFRDGDALSFVLGEAPGWLSIGETSGALSGYPTAPGRYRIKIRVVREQGGEDAQTYVLTVNEPSQ